MWPHYGAARFVRLQKGEPEPDGRYAPALDATIFGKFEGDKVAHEYLYWDQASVLVQVDLLDRKLPVRGDETAAQALNPTQPVNELIRQAVNTNR